MKKDEIVKKLRNYLDAQEFHYKEDELDNGVKVFILNFSTDETAISAVHLHILVDDESCYCRAYVDASARGHLAEVAELLHRANMHSFHGGYFSIDYEDGEICYFQEAVDFHDIEKEEERFDPLVNFPIRSFEEWGDVILKVILGSMTPEEAEKSVLSERAKDSEDSQDE